MIRSLPRAVQRWTSPNTALNRHTNIVNTLNCTLSNSKLRLTRGSKSEALRCLSTGRNSYKDTKDYAEDPEVKEWMNELRKDFSKDLSNQPEKEKEGRSEVDKEASGISSSSSDEEETKEESKELAKKTIRAWSQLRGGKYEKLDTHSQIIYDYDEERLRREQGLEDEEEEEIQDKIKLERGETGVFDIEELVELLREENAQDIVVIRIPVELKYADYMVITSSSSQRHRNALGELIRKGYKTKKNPKDLPLQPEGRKTNWVAMDLGNIILHIMDPEMREYYDIETLWTVGPAFDEKAQVSEEDLVGIRRPVDPLAAPPTTPPSPYPPPPQAVT